MVVTYTFKLSGCELMISLGFFGGNVLHLSVINIFFQLVKKYRIQDEGCYPLRLKNVIMFLMIYALAGSEATTFCFRVGCRATRITFLQQLYSSFNILNSWMC
jgi:hypothetical protein